MKKVFDFIKNKIKLNNSKNKGLLLKQISLLCVILIMLVTVVWAWFSENRKTAEASGLNVIMSAGDTMLISLDGGINFVPGIDLLSTDESVQANIGEFNKIMGSDGKLLLSMQDITSDGKTFYRPKFNEENGQSIPDTSEKWDPATKNRAYISQDVIFRTNEECTIFMGSETKVTTFCEINKKQLVSATPAEIGNKSKSGNFSNDCIVGALRISAVDTTNTTYENGNLKFVCIPRSDIELVRNGNEVTIKTGNAVSSDTAIHTHYDSTYQTNGTTELFDTILNFNDPQPITKTVKNDKTGFYEASATINLWLEGCDPEVTRLLSGGKYQVNFQFSAVETN